MIFKYLRALRYWYISPTAPIQPKGGRLYDCTTPSETFGGIHGRNHWHPMYTVDNSEDMHIPYIITLFFGTTEVTW